MKKITISPTAAINIVFLTIFVIAPAIAVVLHYAVYCMYN
jgi:hypothetical protein